MLPERSSEWVNTTRRTHCLSISARVVRFGKIASLKKNYTSYIFHVSPKIAPFVFLFLVNFVALDMWCELWHSSIIVWAHNYSAKIILISYYSVEMIVDARCWFNAKMTQLKCINVFAKHSACDSLANKG